MTKRYAGDIFLLSFYFFQFHHGAFHWYLDVIYEVNTDGYKGKETKMILALHNFCLRVISLS